MKLNKKYIAEVIKSYTAKGTKNTKTWILERLAEKSTRRILITMICTSLGVTIAPGSMEAILLVSGSIITAIGIGTKEATKGE